MGWEWIEIETLKYHKNNNIIKNPLLIFKIKNQESHKLITYLE